MKKRMKLGANLYQNFNWLETIIFKNVKEV